jgi:prolyl-tRNA synthetase
VPIRLELGPRDVAADRAVAVSRLGGDKEEIPLAELAGGMTARLASVQQALYDDALAFREANTHEITSFDAFATGVEERGGFWVGAWCGDSACETEISARTRATIRFLPLEVSDPGTACVHCGRPGAEVATWARAY